MGGDIACSRKAVEWVFLLIVALPVSLTPLAMEKLSPTDFRGEFCTNARENL